ncbi:MAG: hypothetical protein N3B15_09310 [Planctomycetota bacterium]|nr:hypothetical protein [Planctomycetota bacterium]
MSLLLLAAAAGGGEPSFIVEPLGIARAGAWLRVRVASCDLPLTAACWLTLRDGRGAVLDRTELALPPDGEAWAVLQPAELGDGRLWLTAELRWSLPGLPPQQLLRELPIATPPAALAEAAATVQRLRERTSPARDPLPWLWAEQIADLTLGPPSHWAVERLSTLAARLQQWLAQPGPAARAGFWQVSAFYDPVDQSVQPLWLALPPGSGPHPLVLLLGSEPAASKAAWQPPLAARVQPLLAAGLAVLVPYPAGDAGWRGAARRRLPLAIAHAARLAPLDLQRGCCLAAEGVEDPPYPRLALDAEPAACLQALAPARDPPALAAWWAGEPFALVVGSAEHRAAVAANRRLAEGLRAAYAAHAHAIIELHDDRGDPAELSARHLVLLGNPRSHRWLRAWRLALPWVWDHRQAQHRDGRRFLRSEQPLLILRARAPDGRPLWILDGAPPEAWDLRLPETP